MGFRSNRAPTPAQMAFRALPGWCKQLHTGGFNRVASYHGQRGPNKYRPYIGDKHPGNVSRKRENARLLKRIV